ncbi:MAG: hypothetical protein AAB352_00170 [Patescibacteria group bacterium]
MATYRYFVGPVNDFCGIDRLFALDSDVQMGSEKVLEAFNLALEKVGFKPQPRPKEDFVRFANLGVEEERIYVFRGQEVELLDCLVGVDQALAGIGSRDALVVASTFSHNSGDHYGYRLLAVPWGSRLYSADMGHSGKFRCRKDINHWMAFNDQFDNDVVELPNGSRLWDGKKWKPVSELTLYPESEHEE